MQALQLKQRVEALKLLERALLTCQRLDDEREKMKSQANNNSSSKDSHEKESNGSGGLNMKESSSSNADPKKTMNNNTSMSETSTQVQVQASSIISPVSKYEHSLMALATEGCVLVWNIAKPLLRSSLRKHAHRAMGLASAYLANNHSPLQSLRASLHLELAKCEMSTDFLAKVKANLKKIFFSFGPFECFQTYHFYDQKHSHSPVYDECMF